MFVYRHKKQIEIKLVCITALVFWWRDNPFTFDIRSTHNPAIFRIALAAHIPNRTRNEDLNYHAITPKHVSNRRKSRTAASQLCPSWFTRRRAPWSNTRSISATQRRDVFARLTHGNGYRTYNSGLYPSHRSDSPPNKPNVYWFGRSW